MHYIVIAMAYTLASYTLSTTLMCQSCMALIRINCTAIYLGPNAFMEQHCSSHGTATYVEIPKVFNLYYDMLILSSITRRSAALWRSAGV